MQRLTASRPPAVPGSLFRRRSTRLLAALLVTLAIGLPFAAGCAGGAGPLGASAPDRLATASASASGTAPAPPTATPTVRGAPAPPDLHPDPSRLERAEVIHIVDGDTIDVGLDGRQERVRYYGNDTPERGEPCFGEAAARNEQLAGDRVLLLPDARERDRSGRLLRYVFDEAGRSIDATLIAEGLAHAWPEDGAYLPTLVALEANARAAGVGCLWQP